MPERKFKKFEEQKPINCLRRSPRLHRENQIGTQSPKTPKPAETRRGRLDSFSTPTTKFKKTGHGVLGKGGGKETESNSEKSGNGCRRPARTERRANFSSPDLEKRQRRSSAGGCRFVKGSEKSGEGSRRSGRRDRGANVGKRDEVLEDVIEKRVTRSSVRRNKVVIYEISDSDSEEDSAESVVVLSKERKTKVGVDYVKKNADNFEKMVTRSSSKTDMKKASNVSNTSQRKGVISDEIEPKGNDELSKIDTSRKDVKDFGIMMRNEEQNCTRKARIGEKRKRDGVEEKCKTAQGWTNDQEFALQRAYFTAKPTPQFWKKVARMVPGKSADECFDRIHSDHLTPPQPRTRSRARRKEPSPLSFSASKLLSPVAMKSKRLRTRRRTLLAQKTVRQILQKQQKEDQDYNADLFAILEPTMNPSPVDFEESTSFVSPAPNKASPFLTACRQMSSNSSQKVAFASPPVLKQIKNKALHEKYIDQLHCREAKRKAAALRNSRNLKDQIDEDVNDLKQNLVKAAKDALVSDAQDAISKFRSLQSRIDEDDSTSCDDDDDDEDEDEDEDEDDDL